MDKFIRISTARFLCWFAHIVLYKLFVWRLGPLRLYPFYSWCCLTAHDLDCYRATWRNTKNPDAPHKLYKRGGILCPRCN